MSLRAVAFVKEVAYLGIGPYKRALDVGQAKTPDGDALHKLAKAVIDLFEKRAIHFSYSNQAMLGNLGSSCFLNKE
ncbi:hypothetical protein ACFSQE_11970 [Vogesella fluminis]|uniref:hypothetical protein n=1 Tax=Vogesella fluminis TaxID=1069161 RepID=UPI003635778C